MPSKLGHTGQLLPTIQLVRFERYNLVLVVVNSLLFSALFASDSIAVFLVRAAFNGSGIIMVLGLLSLIAGNIAAGLRYPAAQFAPFGSYYASFILAILQAVFGVIMIVWLMVKYI